MEVLEVLEMYCRGGTLRSFFSHFVHCNIFIICFHNDVSLVILLMLYTFTGKMKNQILYFLIFLPWRFFWS